MKYLMIAVFLVAPVLLEAQNTYKGTLGGQGISFATDAYEYSEEILAVYSYLEEGIPIWLSGFMQNGNLFLDEVSDDGVILVKYEFPGFDDQKTSISGKWIHQGSGDEQEIFLTLDFKLSDCSHEFKDKELFMVNGTENLYFSVLTYMTEDDYYARISDVLIYDRATHELLQSIEGLDAQSIRGFRSVSIGDYNFDSEDDFCVFGEQFAGPNTKSFYFIFDPVKEEFNYSEQLSNLMSAEFDSTEGIIIERNVSGNSESARAYGYDANGTLVELNMIVNPKIPKKGVEK